VVLHGLRSWGGGSLRIMIRPCKRQVLQTIGTGPKERSGTTSSASCWKALDLGAPPIGGIAFGLDSDGDAAGRWRSSIRDNIAFPTQQARCLPHPRPQPMWPP